MTRKVLENHDLLAIAVHAAEDAAAFIRGAERPDDPAVWGRKGQSDFVTDIDKSAERIISQRLVEAVPGTLVRGEELSPDAEAQGLVWVVDPLDGTTNYLHGYPAYAVSVAAIRDGVPLLGVVVDVPRGVTYAAAQGEGAWLGESRMHVSKVANPADALLGTGFPFKTPRLLDSYLTQFAALLHRTGGIRRAGSAALDLVDVALGRFDGFWELDLAPWDVAAGTVLVREAGGFVTDADGSEDVIKHGSIVAGNPTIHEWLLRELGTL